MGGRITSAGVNLEQFTFGEDSGTHPPPLEKIWRFRVKGQKGSKYREAQHSTKQDMTAQVGVL